MRKIISGLSVASLAFLGATGCNSFLSSDSVTNDPNQPTSATASNILGGLQAEMWTEHESQLALMACILLQQCSGAGSGRFEDFYNVYQFDPTSFSLDYSSMYVGGGLVDIKRLEDLTTANNDIVFRGVVKMYEAWSMITVAAIWGDVPYSQAAQGTTFPTPVLDKQLDIYDALLVVLDEAIADLNSGIESVNEPLPISADLAFAGDPLLWTPVAHTLKARIYMHMAEARGPAMYAAALAEANQGITSPAGDFNAQHTTSANEGNLWAQYNKTAFGRDVTAGAVIVNLLTARGDPRLTVYFADVNGSIYLEGTRNNLDFDQPLVTYVENELIKAEATCAPALGPAVNPATSCPGTATFINNVRATYAYATPAPATPTLQDIMEEKYLALYQNIEAWSDYKRTCIPALVPTDPLPFGGEIPGRLYYGDAEVNANPNYPGTAFENAHGGNPVSDPAFTGFRNPDDPFPCP
jgi:starch-binding outer membrane protein, SusD/RagB family